MYVYDYKYVYLEYGTYKYDHCIQALFYVNKNILSTRVRILISSFIVTEGTTLCDLSYLIQVAHHL